MLPSPTSSGGRGTASATSSSPSSPGGGGQNHIIVKLNSKLLTQNELKKLDRQEKDLLGGVQATTKGEKGALFVQVLPHFEASNFPCFLF